MNEVEEVASSRAAEAAIGGAAVREVGAAVLPGTPSSTAASGCTRPFPTPEQPPAGEGVRVTARLARTVQTHPDGKRSQYFTLLGCSAWAGVVGRLVAGDVFSLQRRDDGRVYVWRRPRQVCKPRRKRARRQEGEGAGQTAAVATTETTVLVAGGTTAPGDVAAPAAAVTVVAGAKAPVTGPAPAGPAAAAAAADVALPTGRAELPDPKAAAATVAAAAVNMPAAGGVATGALATAGAQGELMLEVCVG